MTTRERIEDTALLLDSICRELGVSPEHVASLRAACRAVLVELRTVEAKAATRVPVQAYGNARLPIGHFARPARARARDLEGRMKKLYIATALERAAHHQQLAHALKAMGWELTYDWTAHGSVQTEGRARMQEVALAEAQGIADADAVIVLLPGGRGTHVEMGMALALDKRLIVHADAGMFDSTQTCAFYHHPNVQRIIAHRGFYFLDIMDALEAQR